MLWEGARRGDMASIEAAYRKGGRVAWRNPGQDGRTALHAAAREGHAECVKALVRLGADVLAVSAYKETALHEAGSGETVRVLIEMNVEVDSLNKYEATALHCASADGKLDVARALVELGASIHAQNVYGKLALSHIHEI